MRLSVPRILTPSLLLLYNRLFPDQWSSTAFGIYLHKLTPAVMYNVIVRWSLYLPLPVCRHYRHLYVCSPVGDSVLIYFQRIDGSGLNSIVANVGNCYVMDLHVCQLYRLLVNIWIGRWITRLRIMRLVGMWYSVSGCMANVHCFVIGVGNIYIIKLPVIQGALWIPC